METTPLEALIVGPNDTLFVQMPPGLDVEEEAEIVRSVRPMLRKMGIADRTVIISHEVELSVVRSEA